MDDAVIEVAPITRIRRPAPVDVRTVWPSEPRDFTPWLAENLDYLDVLDLGPLSLLGIEHPLTDTDRALDILVETGDGRRVAIENQFGRADHDHLTRGLAYAVGLKAAALVIVAEGHRPEFQAIAEYLNHAAEAVGLDEGGIGIYLVDVGVDQLDDWFLPRFEVVQSPNRWLSQTSVGANPGPRIADEDEFLSRADRATAVEMERILADWGARDGASKTFSTTAVACRIAKPSGRGSVAALTLYPDSIWINSGYLSDALRAAGSDDEDAIEHLITRTWPAARAGEKSYYWHVGAPRAVDAATFADGLWTLWESLRPPA